MSWNPKTSLAMADDSAELQRELLQLWLTQAPTFIDKIAAVQSTGLGEHLHRLKGSLQIIGADAALSHLSMLEDILRKNQSPSIESHLDLLQELLLTVTEEVSEWLSTQSRIRARGNSQRKCGADT